MCRTSQSESSGSSHGRVKGEAEAELNALIVDARNGSTTALDRLISLLSKNLWDELAVRRRRAVRASHGSSDLVQDTILRVREKFDRFERDTFADFEQWARSVLYHRRLEWNRNYQAHHAERHKQKIWDTIRLRLGGRHALADHELAIERREGAERAFALFQSLKPHEQSIIRLRLFEEQSYPQIAEMTGITAEAARKKYDRALDRLKGRFESHDGR